LPAQLQYRGNEQCVSGISIKRKDAVAWRQTAKLGTYTENLSSNVWTTERLVQSTSIYESDRLDHASRDPCFADGLAKCVDATIDAGRYRFGQGSNRSQRQINYSCDPETKSGEQK
jgi:hypothetical protein